MPTLHIEHAVPDFARWKQTFDSYANARARGGVRSYRVLRPVDEPDFAVIDLEFEAEADARAFLEMLQALWRRVDGTVVTQPRGRILATVEEAEVARE
jgi:hypothetical protein